MQKDRHDPQTGYPIPDLPYTNEKIKTMAAGCKCPPFSVDNKELILYNYYQILF